MHNLNRFLIIVSVLLLMITLVHADAFFKQVQETDAFTMMGQSQPAQKVVQDIWIGENRIYAGSEKQSALMDLGNKVMYILNHAEKSYIKMPLDFASGQTSDAEFKPKTEINGQSLKLSVQAMDETKEINGWNCRKYLQTMETMMGPAKSELWATTDIPFDYEPMLKLSATMLSQQPGLQDSQDDIFAELSKIKGITVESITTMTVMGNEIKTKTTLQEFKQAEPPAGIYELPAGYSEKTP